MPKASEGGESGEDSEQSENDKQVQRALTRGKSHPDAPRCRCKPAETKRGNIRRMTTSRGAWVANFEPCAPSTPKVLC